LNIVQTCFTLCFHLSANLTSLSLEENTGHLLATYRPTAKCPNIRHQVNSFYSFFRQVNRTLVVKYC